MIKKIIILIAVIAISAQAGQDRLDSWFAGYNHAYFQDELPKDTEISHNLQDPRFMAVTFYDNGRYHIAFNPAYNISGKTEQLNLIHEMCHIRVFVEQDEEAEDHGPHFQRCMMDLAKQGAFKDIW